MTYSLYPHPRTKKDHKEISRLMKIYDVEVIDQSDKDTEVKIESKVQFENFEMLVREVGSGYWVDSIEN